MEAQVTIKPSPREFDLVREAIVESADNHNDIVRDTKNADAATRSAARAVEAQLRELLTKLGK